jgi:hypothetical protein
VILLLGCASEAYDVADLQIDVDAPLPADAETLRICVAEHGALERGAGNGRMAFPGLRVGETVTVSGEVHDADAAVIASFGPVDVDADAPWTTTPLLPAASPCRAEGALAGADEESWLLAIRFDE